MDGGQVGSGVVGGTWCKRRCSVGIDMAPACNARVTSRRAMWAAGICALTAGRKARGSEIECSPSIAPSHPHSASQAWWWN
jgi:hypothetical protein